MLRSLYTGVAGLRNHQLKMDVTSHNIANVNTVGYKAQRVTLKEGFTQMLRGATRPAGDHGGVNPMQVGLGMAIGSIDSIMDQGSLQSTGQLTDLAVEGRGFFAFSNGKGGTFYGRNGALQLNAQGILVSSTNGYSLLGLSADARGAIPPTTVPGPIRIPFTDKAPASATSTIEFGCNLDADGVGLGTWIHTAAFLTTAAGDNLLTGLRNTHGNSLGIQNGHMLSISYSFGGETRELPITVTDVDNPLNGTNGMVRNLRDLERAITFALQRHVAGATATVNNDTGQIQISGATGITNLVVNNTTNPTSNGFVADTFLWNGNVATNTNSGRILAGVIPTTRFEVPDGLNPDGSTRYRLNIFNANGQGLGLEPNDPIRVAGTIGNAGISSIGSTESLPYRRDLTMGEFLAFIQERLRLPDQVSSSSGQTRTSVEINQGEDPRVPIGSIIIRGQPGSSFAISGLSITAQNENLNEVIPSFFNANMAPVVFQTARDTAVHATSISVYDETGAPHTVTMTFTHSGIPGRWLWELTTQEGQLIIGGNRGFVEFAEDGSPANWVFDDGRTSFMFNPMNGSAMLEIGLDVGYNGSFSGITQFRSPSTTSAKSQDGYAMGKLSEISISEDGEINGLYTNGVSRRLAKILLAEFANPAGLLRAGDSMWAESNNSGRGNLLVPGEGTTSSIKPGALEMSNVDLASEFTDLITTQRGYQANARVISTTDSLLQELVNLVR